MRVVDNTNQTSIKDVLEKVCKAFDSEDLDLYESCFALERRDQIRKRYAMVFVRERCSMQLLESHAIRIDEDSAESAARYLICDHHGPREIVSKVEFVKDGDRWLIDRETVVSRKSAADSRSLASSPARGDQRDDQGWNPMNPDRNKVSPNLQHLIGDVGVRPGMGCSGGNCPNGRCEVR